MQETKKFKAADGKTILVEVNSKKGNKSAVLVVHGFTSHIRVGCLCNAAMQWPEKGYDVWRLSLYPGAPDTRRMDDVTWKDNQSDCDIVLGKMVEADYTDIFGLGHSLGGTNIVYADNARIKAKALWDPACNEGADGAAPVSLHPDYYTLYWDHLTLVPKGYTHEAIGATHYPEPLPKQPPLLVIQSEETRRGRDKSKPRDWPMEKLPAKLTEVLGSDHFFSREGNEKELFRLTLQFFKDVLSGKEKKGKPGMAL
jgi:hypothetical protein